MAQNNPAELEERILKFWNDNSIQEKAISEKQNEKKYTFYDGPPFATGLPHYGHILAGTIKDVVLRHQTMLGHKIDKTFGWDCHGLPVEYEIDKTHNIYGGTDVKRVGVKEYNDLCRGIVNRYTSEWKKTVERSGRWVDMDRPFRTMDRTYMNAVWRVFYNLYRRNAVYKGYRVMPYSTACTTPLSNFEASLNYQNVQDPDVSVKFKVVGSKLGFENLYFLVWTTTPWSLPANVLLCVDKNEEYCVVALPDLNVVLAKWSVEANVKNANIVKTLKGEELLNIAYEQPYKCYEDLREKNFYRVVHGSFVEKGTGTGIVHCAPGFGESDYDVCVEMELIKRNDSVPCHVDERGRLTEPEHLRGVYFKEADSIIIKELAQNGILFSNKRAFHQYPFCWRSDTPLIYKAVSCWFIRVEDFREDLVRCNEEIKWVPAVLGAQRFKPWLENARDWAISRNRYWGTPIPLFKSEDDDYIVVSSIEELERLCGRTLQDVHYENLVDVQITQNGKVYKRISEVFDCWFESGSLPYARSLYQSTKGGTNSFTCENLFPALKDCFPADFIAEGVDQIRGWFYTLHVLSVLQYKKPAFKNVIVNGLILAEDGKKMSKRLKNYPEPGFVLDKYGADALRLYLTSSPASHGSTLCFSEKGLEAVRREFLLQWDSAFGFLEEYYVFEKLTSIEQTTPRTTLDKCLYLSTNRFVNTVIAKLEAYELWDVMRIAKVFLESFKNVYVRLNKFVIRSEGKEGFRMFMYAMYHLSLCMAPFAPFFSEHCYQRLQRYVELEKKSIHLCQYSKLANEENNELLRDYDLLQRIIESVRRLRTKANIPLKQPLSSLKVIGGTLSEELNGYLMSEANVKEIHYDPSVRMDYNVKLNYRLLGEVRPKDLGRLKSFKETSDSKEVEAILKNKGATINDLWVPIEELIVKAAVVCEENEVSDDAQDLHVVLNTKLTSSLIAEGGVRSVRAEVQRMRKEQGLRTQQRATVQFSGATGELGSSLNELSSELNRIKELSEGVSAISLDRKSVEKKIAVNGQEVTIVLEY